MIDNQINNKSSVKYYVKRFLDRRKAELNGKVVVDLPAGSGVTSELLFNYGANVKAFDLFPEYFMLSSVECNFADATKGIPLDANSVDLVICQEGIEHFSDQLYVLTVVSG